MVHRLTLVRFVAPVLAIGALVLSMPVASAGDTDGKLVALTTTPRPKASPRTAPVKKAAAKPAVAAKSAPASPAPSAAPATAATRQAFNGDESWGQINGDRVNVRTGPGLQNPVITTLHGGEYVKARALQDGWLEIGWPQTVPVWVGKEYVQAGPDAADWSGTVTAAKARVYSAGTPQSTLLAKLDAGTRVAIVGQEGNWYRIKAPESAAAYVSYKYVITGVAPATPVAEPATAAQPAAAPAASVASVQRSAEAATPVVRTSTPAPAAAKAAPQPNEDLLAAIDETRRELLASAPAKAFPLAPPTEPVVTDRAATQTKEGLEAQEQAAAKRLEELETARRAAEAKKQAEVDEQARREAEAKRLEELETARRVAEAKKQALGHAQARLQAEAQAEREAEATRLVAASAAAPRAGSFVDPSEQATAKPQFIEAPSAPAPRAAVPARLPEPNSRPASAGPKPAPAPDDTVRRVLMYESPAPAIETEEQHAAAIAATSETLKRVQSKFVVPSQPATRTARRAEVVRVTDEGEDAAPATAKPKSPLFVEPAAKAPAALARATPTPQPQAAPGPQVPELPKPVGAPPASYRLQPFFETQVRNPKSDANVITAEGTLERRSLSPVAGVQYALASDGCTLHFLTAATNVSLEGFVGRRVSVTGVPQQGSAGDASVLEVGSITAQE